MENFVTAFDTTIDNALFWLTDHAAFIFDGARALLKGLFDAVQWLLLLPPFYVTAALVGLLAWRVLGLGAGVATALALAVCAAMGLWTETMATLALVIAATVIALAISLPLGVLAGLMPRLDRALVPVLDLVQTMPPYIYLLPSIALLGFGPATALVATVIVAMPPAIRLTSLGIRQTPHEFIELGQATGVTPAQMFWKIRLPFALPSIMAGVNQSLMMAFGMVVIAGIVGSGGLGETIYGAIRTLDIATSINASIAIVVLTMVLDRITQSLARTK
ncbi:ABC transporter permease subunit [Paracoccus versutus]|uniref:Glycine betaine/proline transport system permease protein n=1 Tax=Paracoccus versutus TaxID=34007 RepID=A0AAQ0HJM0_PARVE|nr:ABC transporter permease subunit [Paracoccus versutus]KGJ06006.1 ABC transporter permease [Paracoccus versutus]REG54040.1 glycine betaine/proline transport system permease protein [Paracoccus versutus]WEJ79230.1 ABC transporter permease subunit [Paracoccus versutus]